ncbi:hypothetical protein [Desulfofundulus sp.]|uniref:hypothetical protein n=1 Tax=Desulfofundulus sp. TaxID=2282750 RepID=UPI003C730F37
MLFQPWFVMPHCHQGSRWRQVDKVDIRLGELNMCMTRRTRLDVPAEFAAFIPRAELRRRYYSGGELIQEDEFILNSITITHAPRFPSEKERPPVPGPPAGMLETTEGSVETKKPLLSINWQPEGSKKELLPEVSVPPPRVCVPRLKFGNRER